MLWNQARSSLATDENPEIAGREVQTIGPSNQDSVKSNYLGGVHEGKPVFLANQRTLVNVELPKGVGGDLTNWQIEVSLVKK